MDKVKHTMDTNELVTDGDRVLVGLSGGPDSMALLHILHQLYFRSQVEIFAVHINHQFRGQEADQDEEAARQYAERLEIPFYCHSVDVPEYIKQSGLNAQMAARQIRYNAYRITGKEVDANKLALGHHADDQAETVLMRVIRGTGVEGLTGMPVIRQEGQLKLIRPLLGASKQEILQYCDQHHIPYRLDKSNESTAYYRNRIRLELIPQLEQYNPRVTEALNLLAQLAESENDYMQQKTEEALAQVIHHQKNDEIEIQRTAFLPMHIALQRRIIKLILSCLSSRQTDQDSDIIQRCLDVIKGNKPNISSHLKNGIWVHRAYERIEFNRIPARQAVPFFYSLDIPGKVYIPEWNGTIQARITHNPSTSKDHPSLTAVFDARNVIGPVWIRSRQQGDRMQLRGLKGSKKVKDMFIDAKVPQERRGVLPIVVYEEEILWIPGIGVSAYATPTQDTAEYLLIEAIPAQ